MTKITIISCIIVAVCVFQTAEAGLFDKSLTSSLLGNVQDKIANSLGDVKALGDNVIKKANDIVDVNGIETSQKELQTSTSQCSKAYDASKEIVDDVLSKVGSCFQNKIQISASANVEILTSAVNDMKDNLSKMVSDTKKCFTLSNLMNPVSILSCCSNIPQSSQLSPLFEKAVNAASSFAGLFPDMRECYKTAIEQALENNANALIESTKQCVKSYLPL